LKSKNIFEIIKVLCLSLLSSFNTLFEKHCHVDRFLYHRFGINGYQYARKGY